MKSENERILVAINPTDKDCELNTGNEPESVIYSFGKGAEAVILGAFGCGAFKNDPETVARAMKAAIEERKYDFRVIELAVYCTPADERNYEVFKKVFAC